MLLSESACANTPPTPDRPPTLGDVTTFTALVSGLPDNVPKDEDGAEVGTVFVVLIAVPLASDNRKKELMMLAELSGLPENVPKDKDGAEVGTVFVVLIAVPLASDERNKALIMLVELTAASPRPGDLPTLLEVAGFPKSDPLLVDDTQNENDAVVTGTGNPLE